MSAHHHHQSPRALLQYLGRSKMSELGTDSRTEARVKDATIALLFVYMLAEPGTYALFIEGSLINMVANMLPYRWINIGGLFYGCAAMLLPQLYQIAFHPERAPTCRQPRKLAAFAGVAGAVVWGLMAVMSRPVDVEWLTTLFAAKAFINLGLGLLFGIGLNAQYAHEAQERLRAEDRDDADPPC